MYSVPPLSKKIEPLLAVQIREKIVNANKSLQALANEYNFIIPDIADNSESTGNKVFGLTELEKYFIIKFIKITHLSAEDLYDGLKPYFPNLSLGNLRDCIQMARKYKIN